MQGGCDRGSFKDSGKPALPNNSLLNVVLVAPLNAPPQSWPFWLPPGLVSRQGQQRRLLREMSISLLCGGHLLSTASAGFPICCGWGVSEVTPARGTAAHPQPRSLREVAVRCPCFWFLFVAAALQQEGLEALAWLQLVMGSVGGGWEHRGLSGSMGVPRGWARWVLGYQGKSQALLGVPGNPPGWAAVAWGCKQRAWGGRGLEVPVLDKYFYTCPSWGFSAALLKSHWERAAGDRVPEAGWGAARA